MSMSTKKSVENRLIFFEWSIDKNKKQGYNVHINNKMGVSEHDKV